MIQFKLNILQNNYQSLIVIALLSGCAVSSVRLSPYVDSTSENSGIVEFNNKSAGRGMNLIFYDNPSDCTYPKYVAMFNSDEKHFARVSYKSDLTIGVSYIKVAGGYGIEVESCGGIYTVPFENGSLRVNSIFIPEVKQCLVNFESKLNENEWLPINSVKKRTQPESPATFTGGSFCGKYNRQ